MAKKKRKRKGKEPAGLRRYRLAHKKKHKRKATTVAKKKRRKSGGGKRRSTRGRRRSGGGNGGRLFGIGPTKSTQMDILGAGAYGFLEGKAKADPTFILNKIPRPVAQLGFSGGTALALYVANKFVLKNKYVEHLANGAASVAMYQMGRQGSVFTSSADVFVVSGEGDYDMGGEIDDATMGALAAEGDYVGGDDDDIGADEDDLVGYDDMEGIPTMGVD